MEKKFRYLVPGDYMADPAVHVFDGKLYIYPSHDRESGVEENDNGDHFDMCDYHVLASIIIERALSVLMIVNLIILFVPCITFIILMKINN